MLLFSVRLMNLGNKSKNFSKMLRFTLKVKKFLLIILKNSVKAMTIGKMILLEYLIQMIGLIQIGVTIIKMMIKDGVISQMSIIP